MAPARTDALPKGEQSAEDRMACDRPQTVQKRPPPPYNPVVLPQGKPQIGPSDLLPERRFGEEEEGQEEVGEDSEGRGLGPTEGRKTLEAILGAVVRRHRRDETCPQIAVEAGMCDKEGGDLGDEGAGTAGGSDRQTAQAEVHGLRKPLENHGLRKASQMFRKAVDQFREDLLPRRSSHGRGKEEPEESFGRVAASAVQA